MAHSTLRGSVEDSNKITEFIESGKFQDWFKSNLLLDEDFLSESSSDQEETVRRKTRNYKPPGKSKIEDYFSETVWGRLISDESVKVATSASGKVFRRRFRVPYPVFEFLVKITKDHNLFEYAMDYKVIIPEELSLMAILRILGRGECLDTIEELS